MKLKSSIILIISVIWGVLANSEPFIATDQLWLRADIETLANLGVIKTPVSTWPLTWGPVLKDLNNASLNRIPEPYHNVYFRVLRAGRKATGKDTAITEFRLSAHQEPQLFRYFGDKARDKKEFSTRTSGMTNNFAWNLEVTLAPDSTDGDDKRFDGSYLAGIGGNWIFYAGQVEKWWGPGFQHSLILSNNAKAMPALNIQRNYAEPFESVLLSWLGSWTFHSFIGQLDDARTVDNAKLLGMSVTFKPLTSLEIGLRRTAQWGGEGRPETLDSLLDMFVGLDNCDEGNLSCDDQSNEPGNQLGAIDLNWRSNYLLPLNLYMQLVGEDEAGYFPSKKSYLYGLSVNTMLFDNPLWISLESLDTKVRGDGNVPGEVFTGYNVLYEHSLYQHGYRYHGRSLGSTLDNDSRFIGLSMTYQDQDWGKFFLSGARIKLNVDGEDRGAPGGHSLTSQPLSFSEIQFKWQYLTEKFGAFTFKATSRDEDLLTHKGLFETTALGLDWTIQF